VWGWGEKMGSSAWSALSNYLGGQESVFPQSCAFDNHRKGYSDAADRRDGVRVIAGLDRKGLRFSSGIYADPAKKKTEVEEEIGGPVQVQGRRGREALSRSSEKGKKASRWPLWSGRRSRGGDLTER